MLRSKPHVLILVGQTSYHERGRRGHTHPKRTQPRNRVPVPVKRGNRRSGFWRKDLRLVAISLSTNRGHHETHPRNLRVCSDNGGDGSRAATAD